jgi:hypothetical protein
MKNNSKRVFFRNFPHDFDEENNFFLQLVNDSNEFIEEHGSDKDKYKVFISYSLVEFCNLIDRNIKRMIEQIKSFKSNNKSKESGDECQFSLLVEALSLDKSCSVVKTRTLTSEWRNKD